MLVEDVMQTAVITITPKTSLPEAMRLVSHRGVRHLPVVEDDTETNVLELFVKGMGAGQPSSRIDVRLGENSAALAELVHAIEDASVEICSVMTLGGRSGHKDVVIRVRSIDPRPAIANLRARGYAVRDPREG